MVIPIPHPGLGEDPALLSRLPGEWQVCSDRPFCRSLGSGRAATLPQSSNGRQRRNSSSQHASCQAKNIYLHNSIKCKAFN
nr:MAG TPA: hypothetical protein [Caudoviricetes sp.]